MTDEKTPPDGLSPKLVKALLDKLETSPTFRQQFQKPGGAGPAMASLGYTGSMECLSLKDGATLASPERIKAQRAKLESTLVAVQQMFCPMDAQEIERL